MMRAMVSLSRPFGRNLGHRIAMQLIAISCLFMLICLHLQYEFANRAAASASSSSRAFRSSTSNRRKYDKRSPDDEDDENFVWYGGDIKEDFLKGADRTRKNNNPDDDEAELLYIDINDEQKNLALKDSRGVQSDHAPGLGVAGRGASGGSGANLAGAGQYPVGRKALLSKRGSSVGDEYQATAESDERSYAGLPLQTWASRDHSMDSESRRFFKYITTLQMQCREQRAVGSSNPAGASQNWPWTVCFDEGASYVGRGALRPGCVVYSFGARSSNIRFETEMAERGCEVHVFDPSGRVRAHVVSEANHGKGTSKATLPQNVFFHKTTLDWRDSNLDGSDSSSWRPRKLSAIMSKLGHDTIDIVRADLQSAEWKVLENVLLDGTVSRLHQLLFTVHLNWSGFEVQGANHDVIRFWYSVLRELELAGFRLWSSVEDPTEPPVFLGQTMPDISSTYTLGWVNGAWR